jgi:hypothetical protein
MENGMAEIILTDIIWRGEYVVINKKVVLTFEDNYEIPDRTLVFEILNKSKLRKADDKTIWKKMIGESIWD